MRQSRWKYFLVISGLVAVGQHVVYAQAGSSFGVSRIRQPVAAAICDQERLLCIANQRSGTLTIIDLERKEVSQEQKVAERLSDIVALDLDGSLLVTDESAHELLVVRVSEQDVEVTQRVRTPHSPVNLAVSEDGGLVSVAGLWSHRVALFGVVDGVKPVHQSLEYRATLRLPFAVRKQVFFTGETPRLVVADAFGGKLALIDVEEAKVESIRELPGHNLRGVAVSEDGEHLIIAHQTLSSLARADYNDVIWGNLIQNVVREVPVGSLLNSGQEWLNDSRVTRLGEAGDGAADPAGIAVLPKGKGTLIALAGVNEIAVHLRGTSSRIDVGARPLEIIWDEKRQVAYVICSLDDSVVVVDPEAGEVLTRISLGQRPNETSQDRGERLFYDGHQSLDGWLSCHSCHPDGHTNHGLADTFGDDSFDTPKKVPSLLGVRDTNPWAWNGKFRELHQQVHSSFISTMRGGGVDADGVNDVVSFLHSLESPPPVEAGTWTDENLSQIDAGRHLFNALGCRKCHVPPLTYTLDMTFDVGLQDEAGLGNYNPPSLRGLSQRQTYFHDGRASSLDDVFLRYGHQLNEELTQNELQSLLAFLRSL